MSPSRETAPGEQMLGTLGPAIQGTAQGVHQLGGERPSGGGLLDSLIDGALGFFRGLFSRATGFVSGAATRIVGFLGGAAGSLWGVVRSMASRVTQLHAAASRVGCAFSARPRLDQGAREWNAQRRARRPRALAQAAEGRAQGGDPRRRQQPRRHRRADQAEDQRGSQARHRPDHVGGEHHCRRDPGGCYGRDPGLPAARQPRRGHDQQHGRGRLQDARRRARAGERLHGPCGHRYEQRGLGRRRDDPARRRRHGQRPALRRQADRADHRLNAPRGTRVGSELHREPRQRAAQPGAAGDRPRSRSRSGSRRSSSASSRRRSPARSGWSGARSTGSSGGSAR